MKINKENDYTMNTATACGYGKSVNQDASVVVVHPKDPSIKMLVVADGVSGCAHGELAAQEFCRLMKATFINTNPREISAEKLKKTIKDADFNIHTTNKLSGEENSTIASVVWITDDNTYIATVGDTRVYLEKNNSLEKIDRLENFEEKACAKGWYKSGLLKYDSLDYRRPESYIGYNFLNSDNPMYQEIYGLDVLTIDTSSYDGILVVSDGVYKELDDKVIASIFTKCKDYDIATSITEQASLGRINDVKYQGIVPSTFKRGQDDITAAVYKKSKALKLEQPQNPEIVYEDIPLERLSYAAVKAVDNGVVYEQKILTDGGHYERDENGSLEVNFSNNDNWVIIQNYENGKLMERTIISRGQWNGLSQGYNLYSTDIINGNTDREYTKKLSKRF